MMSLPDNSQPPRDDPPMPAAPWWEVHRPLLRLWAELRTDPRLRGKIDWSGVVQQTLWEAHQAAALRTAAAADQLAWLRRVLANNLADELRKFRCDKRNVDCERLLPDPAVDSFAQLREIVSPASSPSRQLQRAELAAELATALAKLPDSQRTAIVLQHWHGFTVARIAEQMGRSKLAIAGLLKRGLQQLRYEIQATSVEKPEETPSSRS